MRSLPLPTLDAVDVYDACTDKIRDAARKASYVAVRSHAQVHCEEYLDAGLGGELFRETMHEPFAGTLDSTPMSWLYENGLVRKGANGRPFYDLLVQSASGGICPLCMQRDASTLDHNLPKEGYPKFAVLPENLVPVCRDCNTKKLSYAGTNPYDQALHPYFDRIDNLSWLCARLERTTPPKIIFFVQPPPGWTEALGARVQEHFELLGLSKLYSTHSASELAGKRHRLRQIHATEGAAGVKAHLALEALSYSQVNQNSWQAVLNSSLAEDPWFCDGGFG